MEVIDEEAFPCAYLFVLGMRDVQAQGCVPGYYDEYWDGTEYQSYPEQKSKRLNVVAGAYL
jgi:hypothetical protein